MDKPDVDIIKTANSHDNINLKKVSAMRMIDREKRQPAMGSHTGHDGSNI